MRLQILIATGAILAVFGNTVVTVPALAKTAKECAAEWKQAKANKQTAGKKRKDFIAECRGTAVKPSTSTMSPSTMPSSAPPKTTTRKMAPAAPAVATGRIIFPSGVSSKYSNESAGKARMHTCRDQYEANKANNANGGLRWIQKGGGYYSECNKHLKG
jgi:hypothetical protein